jgi:hypothetical protein
VSLVRACKNVRARTLKDACMFMLACMIAAGCATTHYEPQLVARGELTLRYQDGFEVWAGGAPVARGLRWEGLPAFVRCVPAARAQAEQAVRAGRAAVALSWLGGILGVAGFGGLVGAVADGEQDHLGYWLGAGVGAAVAGTLLAGFGRLYKNRANGHAVDATHFYNDAVGSLGATCDDLRYPSPSP